MRETNGQTDDNNYAGSLKILPLAAVFFASRFREIAPFCASDRVRNCQRAAEPPQKEYSIVPPNEKKKKLAETSIEGFFFMELPFELKSGSRRQSLKNNFTGRTNNDLQWREFLIVRRTRDRAR